MGRRYYCDYCERSFIDDVDARKKHLSSAYHQKLRSEHYAACKDPETIFHEELKKEPCRHFHESGTCHFAESCRYTHYTQAQLWQMKEMIEYKKLGILHDVSDTVISTVEDWLLKYKQSCGTAIESADQIFWTYPEQLSNREDLPLSLHKIRPEYFEDSNFNEWGNKNTLEKK